VVTKITPTPSGKCCRSPAKRYWGPNKQTQCIQPLSPQLNTCLAAQCCAWLSENQSIWKENTNTFHVLPTYSSGHIDIFIGPEIHHHRPYVAIAILPLSTSKATKKIPHCAVCCRVIFSSVAQQTEPSSEMRAWESHDRVRRALALSRASWMLTAAASLDRVSQYLAGLPLLTGPGRNMLTTSCALASKILQA